MQGYSFGDFEVDIKTQDAVLRRFAIIGEAAKQLPEDVRQQHPDISWKDIMGMRDILVHEYGGVQIETVWDTIAGDLEIFKKSIEKVLEMYQG